MKMVMMMVMVIMMSVIEKIKYEQRKFKHFQMINYYLSIGNRIFIRCKHFMGIVGQRRTWRDWCSSCELTTTTTTTTSGNRKQKTVIIIKCCTHTRNTTHNFPRVPCSYSRKYQIILGLLFRVPQIVQMELGTDKLTHTHTHHHKHGVTVGRVQRGDRGDRAKKHGIGLCSSTTTNGIFTNRIYGQIYTHVRISGASGVVQCAWFAFGTSGETILLCHVTVDMCVCERSSARVHVIVCV